MENFIFCSVITFQMYSQVDSGPCPVSTLCEKCPNTEVFWSVFSCTRTGYRDLLRYLDTFHAISKMEFFAEVVND